jgi:two-component system, NtrC family, sensor histidine kinase KinB
VVRSSGGDVSLRAKLIVGLGLIFLIIFVLAIFGTFDIERLSNDAEKTIGDNHDSLVSCKSMLVALDDLRTGVGSRVFGLNQTRLSDYYSSLFEIRKAASESNLTYEKSNIAEIHEKENVEELTGNYNLYLKLCLQMNGKGGSADLFFNDFLRSYTGTRQSIIKINDLNMEAAGRKSLLTKHHAGNITNAMAAVGAVCVLVAFFYFWYFPFYISNTTAFLAKKDQGIAEE